MSLAISGNSFLFHDVYIHQTTTSSGKLETLGPLGKYFDIHYTNHHIGKKSYELAEIKMLQETIELCLKKANINYEDIDIYFGGDLNNQLGASHYLSPQFNRPLVGVYSACATLALALIQASIMIENHNINKALVFTVSHNATAERQFRYPLEYGIQRKNTFTFTATGAVSILLSHKVSKVRIDSITLGNIVDYKQYDANDMARAMTPAAYDTYCRHLKDLNRKAQDYDLIVSGDLSGYGKTLMKVLLDKDHQEYKEYNDCGCMLYDDKQNVYQGGSGPVCHGLVTFGYLYKQMLEGKYKHILVLATGALLNPVMINQKQSIPSVCHGYSLEVVQ